MKFLLTSAGISNNSIRNALVDLLGKPIAESSALVIPTGMYAIPGGSNAGHSGQSERADPGGAGAAGDGRRQRQSNLRERAP